MDMADDVADQRSDELVVQWRAFLAATRHEQRPARDRPLDAANGKHAALQAVSDAAIGKQAGATFGDAGTNGRYRLHVGDDARLQRKPLGRSADKGDDTALA